MVTGRLPTIPLDPEQRRAATDPNGAALVLGGAGTGKTHVIAARMAIALAAGESPNRIACLGHSTGQPFDIAERVRQFLPDYDAPNRCFVGTPLELALALLRLKGAEVLGRSPHFTVWRRGNAQEHLALALRANRPSLRDRRHRRRVQEEAGHILSWHWGNQVRFPDQRTPPDEADWPEVVATYQEEKRRQNVVDPGDVIPLVNQALEADNEFRDAVSRGRCLHLLVDDFQDFNAAEYALLRHLEGSEGSLTVALNPNESLRLRGSPDDGLLEHFRLDHRGVNEHTYHLAFNHRATVRLGRVIDPITNDPGLPHLHKEELRFGRISFSHQGKVVPAPDPALLEFEGRPADMHAYILDSIQRFVAQGYSLEDMAILFQDRATLDLMRPLALSRGVPFTVLGSEPPGWDRDVRCITGLLRSVLNPHDWGAFRDAVCANPHLGREGLDSETMLRIPAQAWDQQLDLVQSARRSRDNPLIDADIRRDLTFFVSAWERLEGMMRDPTTHVADLCWQAVGLLEEAQGPSNRLREKAQVERLLLLARERPSPELPHPDPWGELRWFLDTISPDVHADPLAPENTNPFAPDRGLTFSTVEAARGLQWDIVWAVGVSDHVLPGAISPGDIRRRRQAERLFYVWVTRARNQVIFCHAIRSGPTQDARPTPFLEPIGHLLRWVVIPPPGPPGVAQEPAPDCDPGSGASLPPKGGWKPAQQTGKRSAKPAWRRLSRGSLTSKRQSVWSVVSCGDFEPDNLLP